MRSRSFAGLTGLVGLAKGLAVGIPLAVWATRGLGLSAPSTLIAALLASSAGFIVGLIAGRPIWARNAKTEALLKAGVGALIGAGMSVALGRWLSLPLHLSAYSFGSGPAGKLVALSLPLISSALGVFFELDNTGGDEAKPRLAAAPGQQRVRTEPDEPMSNSDLDALNEPPAERQREKR